MWAVPVADRPSLPAAYGRGLVALVVLAVSLAVTTALAGLSTTVGAGGPAWFGPAASVASTLLGIGVNVATFLAVFALLTSRRIGLRRLWPGAAIAAVAWQLLQMAGTYLITHGLRGSTASYGVFGIVLGLLAWIYLAAVVVLVCVELNTVRALGLAPRSLFAVAPADTDMTAADHRAYTAYARSERRKDFQSVDVTFDPDGGGTASDLAIPAPRSGGDGAGAQPDAPRTPLPPTRP
jgi:hypothetical protein